MIFFTSDTHFGHARIIELCNRPFASVEDMNEEIIRRWNEIVLPSDEVYHLGDVALGAIDISLPLISRLNGYKTLVCGNHDRPFMKKGKPVEADWTERYAEHFQEVINDNHMISLNNGMIINLSHFPYDGDSHGDDRFTEARPVDLGRVLLHGHTHSNGRLTRSASGTLQIHVGVDAWDFRPVSETRIAHIVNNFR